MVLVQIGAGAGWCWCRLVLVLVIIMMGPLLSLATEWIKGRQLDDAAKIKNSDIAKVQQLAFPPLLSA